MVAKRKVIDWKKTGYKLENLRRENIHLRRVACRAKGECKKDVDCETCVFEMDRGISREELAKVFNVSESVIYNWENGRTPVGAEDLLFYAELVKQSLEDILIFEE